MPAAAKREAVHDHVLRLAESDPRIVAAAVLGSLAHGGGDEWADLDLTFGVADGASVGAVLEDWTTSLGAAFDATPLLEIVSGELTYRVFLLPNWLQVDLSFAPRRAVQAGPAFRLVFGPEETVLPPHRSARDLLAWGVLYARHAMAAVERGRWWHAEYCISATRDHALTLACLRRDLDTAYGKGFDRLPSDLRDRAQAALVRSLEREELRRALATAAELLLTEAGDEHESSAAIRARLEELAAGRV